MMKTDTQGFEMNVLSGATQLLRSGRIKFLLVEFSYSLLSVAGTKPVDLLEHIYEQGYVCTYLAFHGRVAPKEADNGVPRYDTLDGLPDFHDDGSRSVSFEEFVEALHVIRSPKADPKGHPGWSDLLCWKSVCSGEK